MSETFVRLKEDKEMLSNRNKRIKFRNEMSFVRLKTASKPIMSNKMNGTPHTIAKRM